MKVTLITPDDFVANGYRKVDQASDYLLYWSDIAEAFCYPALVGTKKRGWYRISIQDFITAIDQEGAQL